MRPLRTCVLSVGLSVLVSLAACIADSTKSASDSPASSPIASVQGEPAPPVTPSSAAEGTGGTAGKEPGGSEPGPPLIEGEPATPAEADDVKERAVPHSEGWRITNNDVGNFARWATASHVQVLTGDFNGDGLTDVALLRKAAGWTTMPVAYAMGDGRWRVLNYSIGNFAAFATESHVKVLTDDFNGDGRTDVALLPTADSSPILPMAFANSNGSWRTTYSPSGGFTGWGEYFYFPFTGDFNGDGHRDIAQLKINGEKGYRFMLVAFGYGDGSWRIVHKPLQSPFADQALETGVRPLTGDFNGDGRTDVALLRKTAGWTTMPVAFSAGDGDWLIDRTSTSTIRDFAAWVSTDYVEVLTGDFNGDGPTDVALLRKAAGWTTMPVAFADGIGRWRITNSSSGDFAAWAAAEHPVQVFTGDFDGDGRTDVALLNKRYGGATMPVAFANGDGSWRITNNDVGNFARWAATGGGFEDVKVLTGDFNGDGRTDVALLNKKAGWTTMPVAFSQFGLPLSKPPSGAHERQ